MPYLKTDELKNLLRDAFMSGVIAGYAADHEECIVNQRVEAFEEYYKMQHEREQERRAKQRSVSHG